MNNCLRFLSDIFESSKNISDYTTGKCGFFALGDEVSCLSARRVDSAACEEECNQSVLNIDSKTVLAVLDFNGWVKDSPYEKCDYVLFDKGEDRKRFALCELTCSLSKYVTDDKQSGKTGKRAKAMNQMQNIWNLIYSSDNPVLSVSILQFREKAAIFGWRERKIINNSRALINMREFSRTPGSTGISIFPQLNFGNTFNFIQVKHPAVFQW